MCPDALGVCLRVSVAGGDSLVVACVVAAGVGDVGEAGFAGRADDEVADGGVGTKRPHRVLCVSCRGLARSVTGWVTGWWTGIWSSWRAGAARTRCGRWPLT